ncbi:unnamed protein product [marine sediment metagenome]|uniref:Uncharacterized protein n=1 Tax=marine sediment metagenome TaxID=412755 RepID=X1I8N5_9ZZZZ
MWHNKHPNYYIRVGSTSRESCPEELHRLSGTGSEAGQPVPLYPGRLSRAQEIGNGAHDFN